ncbi:hypothetical protein NPIL_278151 [Nephila pilipes]|uniref:Uncharacterized protein n=1 Tax=Nephila pilipes TaxID=299642 RepID=A0A8X6USJ4_NEPPI|nr:hypothetical protein NPIL_278151 [Nephila pilipes]
MIIEKDGKKYSCVECVDDEVSLFQMGDSKTSIVFVDEQMKKESVGYIPSCEEYYEEKEDEENKHSTETNDKKFLDQLVREISCSLFSFKGSNSLC